MYSGSKAALVDFFSFSLPSYRMVAAPTGLVVTFLEFDF